MHVCDRCTVHTVDSIPQLFLFISVCIILKLNLDCKFSALPVVWYILTTDRFLSFVLYADKMSPQNCPFSCAGGSGRDSLCPAESTPKRRVDRFSRFSTTHGCVQQTDRHTDHATSVAIGRISLHSVHAMRPSYKRCSFL